METEVNKKLCKTSEYWIGLVDFHGPGFMKRKYCVRNKYCIVHRVSFKNNISHTWKIITKIMNNKSIFKYTNKSMWIRYKPTVKRIFALSFSDGSLKCNHYIPIQVKNGNVLDYSQLSIVCFIDQNVSALCLTPVKVKTYGFAQVNK